ncbi:hypothetical protein [Actinomadura harenae]|uniref:Uncharacterized protein n=1 Tax=Actinomadura harenae TaxID=2483351 RepID=A0A3M2M4L7_9ACTN|nr:hypothetical protein [Actinomadura harenae]RMI44501.1 hypothetical protein EBO15_12715 [Actinomadura harenae]
MGFDRPQGERITARRLPSNQRRTFLEVLDQVIGERHQGLRSGLVTRQGCPVLFVVNVGHVARRAEIGCDFDVTLGWSFTWAVEGKRIGPVHEVDGVAQTIARALRASAGPRT